MIYCQSVKLFLVSVNVLATDKGTPSLTTSCFFYVEITDENDNPPVFDDANYNVVIRYETAIDTEVTCDMIQYTLFPIVSIAKSNKQIILEILIKL